MFSSLLADSTQPVWDAPEWYPVLFDSPKNIAGSVFFWLTIALVLAFVVCAVLIKGDARKKFLKGALIAAIVYACAVGITMLALSFAEDGIVEMLFAPLIVLIAVVGGSAIALVVKRSRTVLIITGCLTGAALIATLVCMGVYYAQNIDADGYYNSEETGAQVNQLVLYVSAILLLAVIIVSGFLFDKGKKGFDSKSIAYAAVCIAMSFALSYLKVVEMPQGGSITIASLLPLMIYSYMFGTKKGVLAGFIYGILQAFQDTYILHPAQFLLDYPVAFSAIGLAGMFARVDALRFPQVKFLLGAIVAAAGRFLSHFLSGIFAFGTFATIEPVWLYSLIYQAGYVLPDIAIAIVLGMIVFSSKSFLSVVNRYAAPSLPKQAPKQKGETAAENK